MEEAIVQKCSERLRNLKAGDMVVAYIRARQGKPSYYERYLILEDRIYGSPFIDALDIQNGKKLVINIAWSFLQRAKVTPAPNRDPKSAI